MSRKVNIIAIIKDKHNKVISRGNNSYTKTHTLQAKAAKEVGLKEKIYLHAEVDAIIKAGSKINKAYSIEIFRYDKKGKPVNACPCPICQSLIKTTPIKIIRHT